MLVPDSIGNHCNSLQIVIVVTHFPAVRYSHQCNYQANDGWNKKNGCCGCTSLGPQFPYSRYVFNVFAVYSNCTVRTWSWICGLALGSRDTELGQNLLLCNALDMLEALQTRHNVRYIRYRKIDGAKVAKKLHPFWLAANSQYVLASMRRRTRHDLVSSIVLSSSILPVATVGTALQYLQWGCLSSLTVHGMIVRKFWYQASTGTTCGFLWLRIE